MVEEKLVSYDSNSVTPNMPDFKIISYSLEFTVTAGGVRIYLSPISIFSHLSQIGYPKGQAIIFVQMHDQKASPLFRRIKDTFPQADVLTRQLV